MSLLSAALDGQKAQETNRLQSYLPTGRQTCADFFKNA